ncbi:hypothetical protein FA13DRAFT_1792138 [Coprinellus micaceus]|uniref:Uncharacterized protein n=1 Tax=Coprinellus micaceus TaxID=71717 RepID=A0A4Y7T8R1_COPMI|nr:hypothetical protein FA13DRAFT_1792138 [Coprinellus micaceus]
MDDEVHGQTTNEDDPEVPDAINVGLSQLLSRAPNSPLAKHNAAFKHLQHPHQMTPVTKPPSPSLGFQVHFQRDKSFLQCHHHLPLHLSHQEHLCHLLEVRDAVDNTESLVESELQQMMDYINRGVVDETLQDVALDMDIVNLDAESEPGSSGVDSDSEYVD